MVYFRAAGFRVYCTVLYSYGGFPYPMASPTLMLTAHSSVPPVALDEGSPCGGER
jgi:hypothetical protein